MLAWYYRRLLARRASRGSLGNLDYTDCERVEADPQLFVVLVQADQRLLLSLVGLDHACGAADVPDAAADNRDRSTRFDCARSRQLARLTTPAGATGRSGLSRLSDTVGDFALRDNQLWERLACVRLDLGI